MYMYLLCILTFLPTILDRLIAAAAAVYGGCGGSLFAWQCGSIGTEAASVPEWLQVTCAVRPMLSTSKQACTALIYCGGSIWRIVFKQKISCGPVFLTKEL